MKIDMTFEGSVFTQLGLWAFEGSVFTQLGRWAFEGAWLNTVTVLLICSEPSSPRLHKYMRYSSSDQEFMSSSFSQEQFKNPAEVVAQTSVGNSRFSLRQLIHSYDIINASRPGSYLEAASQSGRPTFSCFVGFASSMSQMCGERASSCKLS
jgi:hypothetical protein